MKRIASIAVVLLAITAMTVAARPHRGTAEGMMDRSELSLTGQLVLAEDTTPQLIVDDAAYTLRMPRMIPEGVEFRNNATMTLHGVVQERSSRDLLSQERAMMVLAVEQNGQRVELMPAAHRTVAGRTTAERRPGMDQQDTARRGGPQQDTERRGGPQQSSPNRRR